MLWLLIYAPHSKKKMLDEHLWHYWKKHKTRPPARLGPGEMQLFHVLWTVGNTTAPEEFCIYVASCRFLKVAFRLVMTSSGSVCQLLIGNKLLYVTSDPVHKYHGGVVSISTRVGDILQRKPMNLPSLSEDYKELPAPTRISFHYFLEEYYYHMLYFLNLVLFAVMAEEKTECELWQVHGLTRDKWFTWYYIFYVGRGKKDNSSVWWILYYCISILWTSKFWSSDISLRDDHLNNDISCMMIVLGERREPAEACEEKEITARLNVGEAAFLYFLAQTLW